jgi:hypothetical protein
VRALQGRAVRNVLKQVRVHAKAAKLSSSALTRGPRDTIGAQIHAAAGQTQTAIVVPTINELFARIDLFAGRGIQRIEHRVCGIEPSRESSPWLLAIGPACDANQAASRSEPGSPCVDLIRGPSSASESGSSGRLTVEGGTMAADAFANGN